MRGTTPHPATTTARPLPWLATMAVAYSLTHHLGFGLAWLGNAGETETRWADWVDLLTPYAVLLPAAAALYTATAPARAWLLYLVGAITYVEGHGIHLAANSVYNTRPGDVAHLWDEIVGHYAWYGGLTLVLIALAATLARRPPAPGPLPIVLAALTGLTFATNALEGGTAVAAIAVSAAFTAWGWSTRDHLGRLLIYAFAPALAILVGYGILQGGFPQPSEIGWI